MTLTAERGAMDMKVGIKAAIAGGVALVAASGMARAAPPSPSNEPIHLPLDTDLSPGADGPIVVATPANDDLERVYPRVALFMQVAGRVVMTCKTLTDGRLDECHVDSEDPVGMGFGAATLRAAAYFRVKPATKDGKPVEGLITIPMRWRTEGEQATAPPPPLPPAPPAALALGRRLVDLEDVAGLLKMRIRPMVERETATLAAESDAQLGQRVIDAFRLGLADAIAEVVERQAHEMAAHESEADLRATVVFLESPAGTTFIAAQRQSDADVMKTFDSRLATLVHSRLCPPTGCAKPAPDVQ